MLPQRTFRQMRALFVGNSARPPPCRRTLFCLARCSRRPCWTGRQCGAPVRDQGSLIARTRGESATARAAGDRRSGVSRAA